MIDIFLLFVLALVFWSLLLGVLKVISRFLAVKSVERNLGAVTWISGRLYPRSGLSFFLLILGIYNLFLAKTEFSPSPAWTWSDASLVIFNGMVLLSFLFVTRALRSGDQ